MVKQGTLDGYPPSAADFTVNDDVLQGLKTTLAEKIVCRESLNSSGTVSRKTSTASDYTPEHTVGRDSRPSFVDRTSVSFSTESCVSAVEQASAKASDDTDTSKKELKDADSKEVVANEGDDEKELKAPPQRKISRFLVSPVLSGKLDVPKEKEAPSESLSNESEEKPDPVATETEKPPEPMPETTEAPVCGPEMINTLEQLKISLDNLKHSGHVAHKKENEGEKKPAPELPAATPKPVLTQPNPISSHPFVPIPIQPVSVAPVTTVPVVQHTQTYQQPVVSVPPLLPQALVVQYVAPTVLEAPQQTVKEETVKEALPQLKTLENLKLEAGVTGKGSQPSSPQADAKYDLQTLQQKLSSISITSHVPVSPLDV